MSVSYSSIIASSAFTISLLLAGMSQQLALQFDKTLDIGIPIIKSLTLEAQEANAQTQTTENQSLNTYRNDEYGFTFQYPANWYEGNGHATTSFEKRVIVLEAPERRLTPDGEREMTESEFSVYTTNVSNYLDPDDLQIKPLTSEDYARDETSFMLAPSGLGMSFEIVKNDTTSLAGKNDAWRVDSITSLDGEQRTFTITIFTVRENVAYRLDFDTNTMKVPQMLPIAERIIQSFRFI